MNDMRAAIIPKSDQWNYDDFLSGSMTFKITGVKVRGGTEQPVEISLEGTEKFYRPCKSMSRALVTAWGPESSKYVGRSLTLYGDPTIKWGGLEVGGIRISHMSDIDSKLTMALTATRGNRKPFVVKPLVAEMQPDMAWSKAIAESSTLSDLSKTWALVPHPLKKALEAAKDARKAELTKPASEAIDPFVAEMNQAEQGRVL